MKIPSAEKAGDVVLKKRVSDIVSDFEKEKGALIWPGPRDPLAGLVQTLLTHNTTDTNAFPAYDQMRDKYPTWQQIHEAPKDELAATIKRAGLQNQKADRIQKLLAFVKEEYGDYTADALKEMDFDAALATFGHLPGVKHKTLAVVLGFDLGVDVFPVDTHVHRMCKRLGFVPEKADPVKTFKIMRTFVPEGKGYQFHIHLIRYGREICHARKPDCENCFIKHKCLFYQEET